MELSQNNSRVSTRVNTISPVVLNMVLMAIFKFLAIASMLLYGSIAGFPEGITSALIPCLTMGLSVIYCGGNWFSLKK